MPRYTDEEIDVFGAEALGLGEFAEIVGEQTRGGAHDLVGAAQVLSALKPGGIGTQAIQRRAALQRPALRAVPPTRMNDAQVPVVVFGTTGNTVSATVQLQKYFKPEKLMVIELLNNGTTNVNPTAQVLTGAFVGAANMFPTAPGANGSGAGIHCGAFGVQALGNGINWATAQPAITITLQVLFLSTGTFYGTLFGKMVG